MRLKLVCLALTVSGLLTVVALLTWGIQVPTVPIAQLALAGLALLPTGTVATYRLLLLDR